MPLFRLFSLLSLLLALSLFAPNHLLAQPAANASGTLLPVRVKDKWGYIGTDGKLRIAAQYDHVQPFLPIGYAIVQQGKKVGVIDTLGNFTLPCQFEFVDTFDTQQRLFIVRQNNDWQLRNILNQVIINRLSGKVESRPYQFLVIENEHGKGLMHLQKGIVIAPDTIYQDFQPRNAEFITAVGSNYKIGLIHLDKGLLLPAIHDSINTDGPPLLFASKDRRWCIFDSTGAQLSQYEWYSCLTVLPNIVAVGMLEGLQLYRISDKQIIFKNIDAAYWANGNGITVIRDDLEGIIDSTGREILPIKFKNIESWRNFYITRSGDDKNKLALYSNTGTELLPEAYSDFQPYEIDKSLRIKGAGGWGVYQIETAKFSTEPYFQSIDTLNYSAALATLKDTTYVLDRNGRISWRSLSKELKELHFANNNLTYLAGEKGRGKKMVFFDAEGKLSDSTHYTNYRRVTIKPSAGGSDNINPRNNARRGRTDDQINDNHFWVLHEKSKRWGLRDSTNHKWIIPPTYNSIERYPDLGFTLVCLNKATTYELQFNRLTYLYTAAYGIVSNEHGKLILQPELIGLRVSDFRKGNVARCIFTNGLHGLVHRNGKVIARNYLFMGNISDGKIAFAKGEKLGAHLAPSFKPEQIPCIDYSAYLNLIKSPVVDVSGYATNQYRQDIANIGKVHCEDCIWGVMDTNGTILLKPKYQYIQDFNKGSAMYRDSAQWGLLNDQCQPLLKPDFTSMNFLENSDSNLYYITVKDARYGCLDSNANLIVPMEYDRIRPVKEGFIAVSQKGQWGFVSIARRDTIIGCRFNNIHDFSEGRAAILDKGRWGFIDSTGSVIIAQQYAGCGDFHEGKAWVQLKAGKRGYIDPQGNILFEGDWRKLEDFLHGHATAMDSENAWGIINTAGQWVVKPNKRYRKIELLPQANLAMVYIGTHQALLHIPTDKLLTPLYHVIRPFSDGIALVRKNPLSENSLQNSDWGFIDTTGTLLGNFRFDRLKDFSDGRAPAFDQHLNRWGYINKQGEWAVPPAFFVAEPFSDGRAVVQQNPEKYGLIDTSGNFLMQPLHKKIVDNHHRICLIRQSYSAFHFVSEDLRRLHGGSFTQAHPFRDGVAPVRIDRLWGLINEQGLFVLSPKYQTMSPIENGYAQVGIETRFGVSNTKGEVLIPPVYEFIQYMGGGIFRVENGDRIEYLNMKGEWVWQGTK